MAEGWRRHLGCDGVRVFSDGLPGLERLLRCGGQQYRGLPAQHRRPPRVGDPAPPAPPVANPDTATTAYNTAVTVNVLANDTDANGDTLTITSVSPGDQRTVVINGGTNVTYTPNSGYSGPDGFTYTISDGNGGLTTGTVSVTVNPPQALASNLATIRDGSNFNVDIDEQTAGYVMIKYHTSGSAAKAYLEFPFSGLNPDTTKPATLTVTPVGDRRHAAYPALGLRPGLSRHEQSPGVGHGASQRNQQQQHADQRRAHRHPDP